MRNSTLLFLVKRSESKISNICLALKKRGFGEGRWNGVGGKVDQGESIEEAAKREAAEEIKVTLSAISKVAELDFTFQHNPAWDQLVHVYIAYSWDGEIDETEEMKPAWFEVSKIPYKLMWPDDIFWLPKVLEGSLVKASFTFAEGDVITNQKVEEVRYL